MVDAAVSCLKPRVLVTKLQWGGGGWGGPGGGQQKEACSVMSSWSSERALHCDCLPQDF